MARSSRVGGSEKSSASGDDAGAERQVRVVVVAGAVVVVQVHVAQPRARVREPLVEAA